MAGLKNQNKTIKCIWKPNEPHHERNLHFGECKKTKKQISSIAAVHTKVSGGGKKIKIKITKKKIFFFNLKHIWIGEKKTNKNCMILHCKMQK